MLETERLLLRKPRPGDAEAERLLDGDLRRWVADWETYPAGKFLVERLVDGVLVGRVGFNFFDGRTWERSTVDAVPELGWTLLREHWGNGYATEAARAVREWFDGEHVISLITPDNTRSQRVAERLGARPTETVQAPEGDEWVVWVHP